MYIYTRNVSKFTTEKLAIFEPWCKFKVQGVPLHLFIQLLSGDGPSKTQYHQCLGPTVERQDDSVGCLLVVIEKLVLL